MNLKYMASNLFGQYYTNKANTSKYQTYNYICSNADDGTNNSVIFDDSAVELVDANGNPIAKLDLGDIAANPITDYRNGSFTMNPNEVRLLEGLEFGKNYKKVYFMIPDSVFEIYQDFWEEYCNVDFNFLFNYELDLREFNLKTVYKEGTSKSIVERIQNLLNAIGLEDKVEVNLEEVIESDGNSHYYFTFESLITGYDFLVQDFKLHLMQFAFYFDDETEDKVIINLQDEFSDVAIGDLIYGRSMYSSSTPKYSVQYNSYVTSNIKEMEDNVVFENGEQFGRFETEENFGHYDNMDYPNDELSAQHFYLGEYVHIEGDENNTSKPEGPDEPTNPDTPDIPSDEPDEPTNPDTPDIPSDEPDEPTNPDTPDEPTNPDTPDTPSDDPEKIPEIYEPVIEEIVVEDGRVIYVVREKYVLLLANTNLEIYPFKYPNGASRVWFLVPEFPTDLEQLLSLKINHVRDFVPYFKPSLLTKEVDDDFEMTDDNIQFECSDTLYKKEMVRVVAGERNEKERHSLFYFNEFFTHDYEYKDEENGMISSVKHCVDVLPEENSCQCLFGSETPHIGMYRYLDYVQMHDAWTNVGQFYGLVTNSDRQDDNVKNLANSIFVFNPNDYPVKVNYFIGY